MFEDIINVAEPDGVEGGGMRRGAAGGEGEERVVGGDEVVVGFVSFRFLVVAVAEVEDVAMAATGPSASLREMTRPRASVAVTYRSNPSTFGERRPTTL